MKANKNLLKIGIFCEKQLKNREHKTFSALTMNIFFLLKIVTQF